HHPQAQAPREAKRGQKAHEGRRNRRNPPGGLPGGFVDGQGLRSPGPFGWLGLRSASDQSRGRRSVEPCWLSVAEASIQEKQIGFTCSSGGGVAEPRDPARGLAAWLVRLGGWLRLRSASDQSLGQRSVDPAG